MLAILPHSDMGEFSVVKNDPLPLITTSPPPTTTTPTATTTIPAAARKQDFMDEFLTDPEPYLRRLAEEEIWRKRQRQRMERLRREQLQRKWRRKRFRHNSQGVSPLQTVFYKRTRSFYASPLHYPPHLRRRSSQISLHKAVPGL